MEKQQKRRVVEREIVTREVQTPNLIVRETRVLEKLEDSAENTTQIAPVASPNVFKQGVTRLHVLLNFAAVVATKFEIGGAIGELSAPARVAALFLLLLFFSVDLHVAHARM